MDVKMLERFMREQFPQMDHMGMRIEAAGGRSARIHLPVDNRHLRPGGTISGPTMMALSDCAMYLAILAELGPVALAVTSNLNISFLRKPPAGDIVAEARILKLGRRLATGTVEIHSVGDPDAVAFATLTYAIPAAGAAA
ncbi:PaaI family thioesterase [Oceanibacterium hippocampi]|nr:PaaI family thioesterase [Oceanibacterium hippocampi]